MSTSARRSEHGVGDHVLLLQDVEQARQANGDADAGQGLVRIVPREVIIAAAGADAADLGMVEQDGLVHRAGVVIEAARDREVELEVLLRDAERRQVAHDGAQLVEAEDKRLVPARGTVEEGELVRTRARAGNEAQDLVCVSLVTPQVSVSARRHLVRAVLSSLSMVRSTSPACSLRPRMAKKPLSTLRLFTRMRNRCKPRRVNVS